MHNREIRKWTLLSVTAGLLIFPSLASAQAESEEDEVRRIETIIVTAQKQEENLQDVPLAITAFTGDFLEDLGIRDAMDLMLLSPSLNFSTGISARNSSIAVRGIGSGGGFNAGVDGSVGLYLNDVYIPKQAGILQSLVDIQTVELLKGPQGTLYGANTPAGVLAINTVRPTQEFEAVMSAGVGNFNMSEASGIVSGGLTENIVARLSFWTSQDEGWLKLKQGGNTNSRSEYGMRLRTIWDVNDNFELDLIADYSHIESNCCDGEWIDISDAALATFDRFATGLNIDRELYFPVRGNDGYLGRGEKLNNVSSSTGQDFEVFDHWGASLRGTLDLEGFLAGHTLTATAAYRDFDSNQQSDQDEFGIDVTLFGDQPERRQTTTLELQLSSPKGQFFEYIGGLYYLHDDATFQQNSQFRLPGCMFTNLVEGQIRAGRIPDTAEGRSRCGGSFGLDNWEQTWNSYAAYLQGTANLTDNWSVTLGGRVATDEKDAVKEVLIFDEESEAILAAVGVVCTVCTFTPGGVRVNGLGILASSAPFVDSVENTELTWSASTQYLIDSFPAADRLMIYARAATGYKAPGINSRPIAFPEIPRVFREETSLNYELGVKSTWFDNRLQGNLALFHNNFDDLQQVAANPPAGQPSSIGTFVQNAGELENKGVELEYIAQPVNWLSLNGAFTYLQSEYKEFVGAPCPVIGNIPRDPSNPRFCDFTGFPNSDTPEWRMNHTASVEFPLSAQINWNARATWSYSGDHYINSALDERSFQDAYSLISASIGIEGADGLWEASLWGQNLTDEMYLTSTSQPSLAGVVGTQGSMVGRFNRPRTFGIRATRRL